MRAIKIYSVEGGLTFSRGVGRYLSRLIAADAISSSNIRACGGQGSKRARVVMKRRLSNLWRHQYALQSAPSRRADGRRAL